MGLKYFFQLFAQSSSRTVPVSKVLSIPAAVSRSRKKAMASVGSSAASMYRWMMLCVRSRASSSSSIRSMCAI